MPARELQPQPARWLSRLARLVRTSNAARLVQSASMAGLAGLVLALALPASQALLHAPLRFSVANDAFAAQSMRRPGQAAEEASRRSLQEKLAGQAASTTPGHAPGSKDAQGVSEATARLCIQAGNASPKTLEALIHAGADVQVRTRLNMTPLLLAARSNTADACAVLLKHGTKAGDTDKLGWNALMQAALGNPHPGVATLLVKAGVDVNAKDASGKTALMLAAGAQDARMIRELLTLGSDRTLRDIKGHTALDYARQRKSQSEATRLLSSP